MVNDPVGHDPVCSNDWCPVRQTGDSPEACTVNACPVRAGELVPAHQGQFVVNRWRFFGYVLLVLIIGMGIGGYVQGRSAITDSDLVPGRRQGCLTAVKAGVNVFVDNDLDQAHVPDEVRELQDYCYDLVDQKVLRWYYANGGLPYTGPGDDATP